MVNIFILLEINTNLFHFFQFWFVQRNFIIFIGINLYIKKQQTIIGLVRKKGPIKMYFLFFSSILLVLLNFKKNERKKKRKKQMTSHNFICNAPCFRFWFLVFFFLLLLFIVFANVSKLHINDNMKEFCLLLHEQIDNKFT